MIMLLQLYTKSLHRGGIFHPSTRQKGLVRVYQLVLSKVCVGILSNLDRVVMRQLRSLYVAVFGSC